MNSQRFLWGVTVLVWLAGCAGTTAKPRKGTEFIDLNVKGGWCWFQDERAIVDGGKLIFGSVACPSGDIQCTVYDLSIKTSKTVILHEKLQSDDHNAPAFLKLADGRYLASYMTHGGNVPGTDLMRWRISVRPGDATEWEPERTVSVGAGISYTNLYRLPGEGGRIYNYHRGIGFDPNYMVSDDDGRTFVYGGRLFDWPTIPGEGGSGRPYVRYASNNVDTVHLITTEDHPRNYDNSIYHGYIQGGKLYHSDGRQIGAVSRTRETTTKPSDLTCVFKGDPEHVAWTTDIRLDKAGRPYIAFSVQVGDAKFKKDGKQGGEDLRYFYGRFDGSKWNVHPLAHAGTRLYSPEVDYSGLVALHPGNPDVLFVSTNADPATGKPLISAADNQRRREIFKGVTADGGRTWTWTAVTKDSPLDNIRPIARMLDDGRVVVIWQKGTYSSYTKYDMSIVGMIE